MGKTDAARASPGGIQLLEWSGSTLTKRGLVSVAGNPRRGIRRDSAGTSELIAVSDSDVTAFSILDRNAPVQEADLLAFRFFDNFVELVEPRGPQLAIPL